MEEVMHDLLSLSSNIFGGGRERGAERVTVVRDFFCGSGPARGVHPNREGSPPSSGRGGVGRGPCNVRLRGGSEGGAGGGGFCCVC